MSQNSSNVPSFSAEINHDEAVLIRKAAEDRNITDQAALKEALDLYALACARKKDGLHVSWYDSHGQMRQSEGFSDIEKVFC